MRCARVPPVGVELPAIRIQPFFVEFDVALPINDDFDAAVGTLGRGRHSEKPLRRHPAADRRVAAAARYIHRVRRLMFAYSSKSKGEVRAVL
jgi:hypothetical protein